MKVRRLFGVMGSAIVLTMGVGSISFASAAHAADYPPTTAHEVIEGSTVPATSPTSVSDASGALPFTGGNDTGMFWIGVGAVGTGSFAAWRFRRRRSPAA